MATLGTYKQLVTEKIAQSSTVFYTTQQRVDAINEAVQHIAFEYDIPAMIKKATISFTNGVATPPADFFRMYKLWTSTNNQVLEFTFIYPDQFDEVPQNSADYLWTYDYYIPDAAQRILIAPSSVTSGLIRYVFKPNVMADDSDDSLMPDQFNQAVAYYAAGVLLKSEGNLTKSENYMAMMAKSVKDAIQGVRKIGGVQQNERIISVYEKFPLLYNPPN